MFPGPCQGMGQGFQLPVVVAVCRNGPGRSRSCPPPGVGAEGGVALGAAAAGVIGVPELAGQVVIADGEGYDALGVALEGVLAGDEHHAAAVKVEQIVVHHALQVGGVDPVEEQAVCFVDLVDEADDGVPGRVSDAVPKSAKVRTWPVAAS